MNIDSPECTGGMLASLIRACDDEAGSHILWIDKFGDVHMSLLPAHLGPIGWAEQMGDVVALRYETFHKGNQYVGPIEASDGDYMSRLLDELKQGWASKV